MTTKISVDKYLKMDLLEELGMKTLSPEDRASFLESFTNVLQQRITYRLMQDLSEAKKDRLEAILAQGGNNDAALGKFLTLEVPNFQAMAEEEIAGYKKELLARMKA